MANRSRCPLECSPPVLEQPPRKRADRDQLATLEQGPTPFKCPACTLTPAPRLPAAVPVTASLLAMATTRQALEDQQPEPADTLELSCLKRTLVPQAVATSSW